MTEKFEPLMKEKFRFLRIESKEENVILGSPFVYLSDIESAVQGLLKEIEEEMNNYKQKFDWEEHKEFYEGVWHGLVISCGLIKKWFADVIEDE